MMTDHSPVFEKAINLFPVFEFEDQGVYADNRNRRAVFQSCVVQA
jgi:hypothetical protein